LKFEQKDKENPPQKGGIVFAGSSTFTKWRSMGDDFKPVLDIEYGPVNGPINEPVKIV